MYGNLKKFRKSLKMTQKEFAESIGLANTTYNGYETGAREPNSEFWIAIATKYGVAIDYLMGYSKHPYTQQKMDKLFSSLSYAGLCVAQGYDKLDSHGKEMVDLVIAKELERMETAAIENKEWILTPQQEALARADTVYNESIDEKNPMEKSSVSPGTNGSESEMA